MTIIAIVMTPFSNQAFWGLVWWQVIAIVFALSAIGALLQLWIENNKILNEMPSLKIRPISSQRSALLEILNQGGSAKISATARIIKGGHPDHINRRYIMYWEPTAGSADIGSTNGNAQILVARQEVILPNPLMIGLHMWQVTDTNIPFNDAIWGIGSLGELDQTKRPDDIDIEINISADKKLRKPFQNIILRLSQPTITSLDFQFVECRTRKLRRDKEGYLS